jgi:hypothetical protein
MTFDQEWAETTLHDLALRGTVVEPGMTTAELALAEAAIGANVPPELKLLWATGYPVGDGWPRWNSDPAGQAAEDRAWTERSFAFDIEANGFWMTDWGPRPNADKEAVAVALRRVSEWPSLIRVYSHRFMPTVPETFGGPVISVYQAVDSVIYGNDLADYLHREFGTPRPAWAVSAPRPVPYWAEAFKLWVGEDH